MASGSKPKSKQFAKNFYLFNCDETCKLDQVKSLLRAVEGKVDFKMKFVEQQFRLGNEMTTLVDKTIPQMKMDYAVFMVHAKDHDLFKEDCYGKVYKALKQTAGSGEKLLVVIAGDEKYENEEQEKREFISPSALKAFKTQFRMEFIDGRKSFIFSWNKKHRPIHEEALLHFFDPSKKGKKFEHQARQRMENIPTAALNVPVQSLQTADVLRERGASGVTIACNPPDRVDGARQPFTQAAFTEGSKTTYPRGKVLLSTHMRYGVISYASEDVEISEDGGKWRPSSGEAERLLNEYKSTPAARFKLVTDREGVVCTNVKEESWVVDSARNVLNNCTIS